jgi:hypothetical protein
MPERLPAPGLPCRVRLAPFLFAFPVLGRPQQAYPWPLAIFNELDPRGFQRAADGELIGGREGGPFVRDLSTSNRVHPERRIPSKIHCTPSKKGPGRSDLSAGKRRFHIDFCPHMG